MHAQPKLTHPHQFRLAGEAYLRLYDAVTYAGEEQEAARKSRSMLVGGAALYLAERLECFDRELLASLGGVSFRHALFNMAGGTGGAVHPFAEHLRQEKINLGQQRHALRQSAASAARSRDITKYYVHAAMERMLAALEGDLEGFTPHPRPSVEKCMKAAFEFATDAARYARHERASQT